MHPSHLLFIGPPGTGKTTVAQCFAKAYLRTSWRNYFHEFNASDARKIDDIRNKIKPLSRLKVKQIIFLDEVDGMRTPNNDAQQALRRVMEQTENTIFILTANYPSKIIDAIKSRCTIFRFKPLGEGEVLKKLLSICKSEGIKLKMNDEEREGFFQIIRITGGDLRKAINELEKLITSNKEINTKNVIESTKANIISDCVDKALNGDFLKAKNLLEDAYIMSGNNTDLIFDDLVLAVATIQNEQLQARIFYELGELEHRLRTTYRPLLQFTAFLSFVHVAPHLGG